jgi:hypothetical protein
VPHARTRRRSRSVAPQVCDRKSPRREETTLFRGTSRHFARSHVVVVRHIPPRHQHDAVHAAATRGKQHSTLAVPRSGVPFAALAPL